MGPVDPSLPGFADLSLSAPIPLLNGVSATTCGPVPVCTHSSSPPWTSLLAAPSWPRSQWHESRLHGRFGPLWAERFKSLLIEEGMALQAVALYIDLNPVRAGLVQDPKDYCYCGYGEAVGGGSESARSGLGQVLGWEPGPAGAAEAGPGGWGAVLAGGGGGGRDGGGGVV